MHYLSIIRSGGTPPGLLDDSRPFRRASLVASRAQGLGAATSAVLASLEEDHPGLGRDLARLAYETVLTACVLGVRIHDSTASQPLAPLLAETVLKQRSTNIAQELHDLGRLILSEPDELDLVESVDALGSDLQLLLDRTEGTARAHHIDLRDEFDALYRPLPTEEVAA